jgi:hypothetical protein
MSEYEACGQYFHVLSYRVMAPNFAPNDRGAGNTASDCFEAGYESNLNLALYLLENRYLG